MLNNVQKSVFEEHYDVKMKPIIDPQICVSFRVKVDICTRPIDNLFGHTWDTVFMLREEKTDNGKKKHNVNVET